MKTESLLTMINHNANLLNGSKISRHSIYPINMQTYDVEIKIRVKGTSYKNTLFLTDITMFHVKHLPRYYIKASANIHKTHLSFPLRGDMKLRILEHRFPLLHITSEYGHQKHHLKWNMISIRMKQEIKRLSHGLNITFKIPKIKVSFLSLFPFHFRLLD